MRKLTLELDSLVVQSFQTTAPEPGRGTVHGQGVAGPEQTPGCDSPLCIPSEWHTCPDTCKESCYGTCESCHSCIASCHYTCPQTCGDSCGGTCPQCISPTLNEPVFG